MYTITKLEEENKLITVEQKSWYSAQYDRVFKDIFGVPKNKKLLEAILKPIIGEDVEIIEYLRNELPEDNLDIKRKFVDLLVKTKDRYILIELNNGLKSYTNNRNFAYFSNISSSHLKVGDEYIELPDIDFYLISLDFGLEEISGNKIIRNFGLIEEETGEKFIENIKVISVNMDKIMEKPYNEKYKYLIMLGLEKEELDNFYKGDEIVEEFKKEINKLNSDPEFIQWMSAEEENQKVYKTDIGIARNEGIIEGHASGLEEGKLAIISKLLSKGQTKEQISEMLDMDLKELEKIVN